MCKMLIDLGCSPAKKNNSNQTPYDVAERHVIRQYLLPLQLQHESTQVQDGSSLHPGIPFRSSVYPQQHNQTVLPDYMSAPPPPPPLLQANANTNTATAYSSSVSLAPPVGLYPPPVSAVTSSGAIAAPESSSSSYHPIVPRPILSSSRSVPTGSTADRIIKPGARFEWCILMILLFKSFITSFSLLLAQMDFTRLLLTRSCN
jgi:hypothetical protein